MNEDIAQLVRESLDQLTDGATVPSQLAAAARRRHHRRNAAFGMSAVAAVAVIAVIATVAASLASAGGAAHRSAASLDAYVVSRTEKALARGTREVVQASLTAGFLQAVSWSGPAGSLTQITGGEVVCKLVVTSSGSSVCRQVRETGRPTASGYVLRRGGVTFGIVDYQARAWRQLTLPDRKLSDAVLPDGLFPVQTDFRTELQAVTHGCAGARLSAAKLLEFSWPAFIRQMLGCGAFKVEGRGTVDGVPATKLAETGLVRVPYSAVLWVSRSGYLPLRLAFVPLRGAGSAGRSQIDLRWLPATRANLAKAAILPAPAGFKQLPWR